MLLEIQIAISFLMSYLYNKLPRRRVDLFSAELTRRLKEKFEGHWYPERPSKGSGYRCLLIGDDLDPILVNAANDSGLSMEEIRISLPEKLMMWIDPDEVSYRIGWLLQQTIPFIDLCYLIFVFPAFIEFASHEVRIFQYLLCCRCVRDYVIIFLVKTPRLVIENSFARQLFGTEDSKMKGHRFQWVFPLAFSPTITISQNNCSSARPKYVSESVVYSFHQHTF